MLDFENNDINKLYVNGRYLSFETINSKTIRHAVQSRNAKVTPKLPLSEEGLASITSNIKKITSVRLRNLVLRNIHGDVFTNLKLAEKGLIESSECNKCRNVETLMHLLHECWYSGRIWTYIKQLYRATERYPRNYVVCNEFVCGADLSRVKVNLHLEIIRMLQQKERPSFLPRTFVRIAISNLLISEKISNDRRYLKKLASAMDN